MFIKIKKEGLIAIGQIATIKAGVGDLCHISFTSGEKANIHMNIKDVLDSVKEALGAKSTQDVLQDAGFVALNKTSFVAAKEIATLSKSSWGASMVTLSNGDTHKIDLELGEIKEIMNDFSGRKIPFSNDGSTYPSFFDAKSDLAVSPLHVVSIRKSTDGCMIKLSSGKNLPSMHSMDEIGSRMVDALTTHTEIQGMDALDGVTTEDPFADRDVVQTLSASMEL